MAKQTTILEVYGLITTLHNDTNAFLHYFNHSPMEDRKVFECITIEMVDSMVAQKLKWSSTGKDLSDILESNLPWYDDSHIIAHYYQRGVIDYIDAVLADVVTKHFNSKTWDILEVIGVCGDIAIVNHGDYRIAEWERMVEEGQIESPESPDDVVDVDKHIPMCGNKNIEIINTKPDNFFGKYILKPEEEKSPFSELMEQLKVAQYSGFRFSSTNLSRHKSINLDKRSQVIDLNNFHVLRFQPKKKGSV